MAPDTPVVEDDSLSAARARAAALGCPAIAPGVGAALRFLATVLRAKAVVEIGTGTGVSALYLLRGMVSDGVLTSIDVEPEHQAEAKRALRAAGIAPGRTRLIMGRALDVLPRLTDGGYDLLFVDAAKGDYAAYHDEAVRLLRPGGVLAFADGANLRDLVRAVRADDRLVPLTLADGLLVAAKSGELTRL
ncbi:MULTISPECIES: O-methyltransferase [Actinokineospora]|uniref:O-methyltransferase n=1 Tax=Actinokineospora fastidiosa TaxID=1816 RepID=A0A918G2L6_9PSEU|nr:MULTISPECIES: class I SAM-dependent methyltransferase [Actinokineospora]UVS77120.1 Putative O-methyltransferase [Actinokineospora sp. UTMC 2448]GGS13370.1 O-methyltransferase [Actinokineospora fastidiosa]